MECILIPIAIVVVIFIIIKISDISDKKKARERAVQYIEGLNLSETLSRQIKTYMQTGKAPNDYFYIGDLSEYISLDSSVPKDFKNKYSRQLGEVILYYKKRLIENINNGTDYQTKYGTVREIYLGTIEEYNYLRVVSGNNDFDITIKADSMRSNSNRHCYYIGALQNYNFTITYGKEDRHTTRFGDYVQEREVYIYAYIKL